MISNNKFIAALLLASSSSSVVKNVGAVEIFKSIDPSITVSNNLLDLVALNPEHEFDDIINDEKNVLQVSMDDKNDGIDDIYTF
jgi:hypothetical protein